MRSGNFSDAQRELHMTRHGNIGPWTILTLLLLTASRAVAQDTPLYKDPSRPVDARVADLRYRILYRELERRSRQTRRQLLVDPLTGLGNRRRLEQELGTGRPAAVLFLDVDNFKQVNDHAGHTAGDQVLRRMADLLRGCCRRADVLVRYGGDEFVVLLAGTSWAAGLGERIVARVREGDWRPITGGMDVTVSVGVSYSTGGADALRRSDAALRLAKRTGRDAMVQL